MTTDAAIGERVYHEMWRRRITQTNLASELGITQTAVSRKLRGNRPWFASELASVAAILRVPVSVFYEETDGSLPRLDSNQQPSGYSAYMSLSVAA